MFGARMQPCGEEKGNSSLSETRSAPRRLNVVAVNSNLRAVTSGDRDWVLNALCRDRDPDELFVRGRRNIRLRLFAGTAP